MATCGTRCRNLFTIDLKQSLHLQQQTHICDRMLYKRTVLEMSTGRVARGPPGPDRCGPRAGPWLAAGRAIVFQPALSKIFVTISKQFHQVYNIGYCDLQHCACRYYYRNTIFNHSLHGTRPSPVLHITSAKVEQSLLLWGLGRCCRLRAGPGRSWLRAGPGRAGLQNGLEIVSRDENFRPVHISKLYLKFSRICLRRKLTLYHQKTEVKLLTNLISNK